MRIGLIGDQHLHSIAPSRRLDKDYFTTQIGKLKQAYSIFSKNKCDIVLQAGDFFDAYTVSNNVTATAMRQLQESDYWGKVYCVYGQHDISGHSAATVPNSPLTVLESAGALTILGGTPVVISDTSGSQVALYGAPFGLSVPVPQNKSHYNIMVGHIMCGDHDIHPGQNITKPKNFLRTHAGYNMVLLGDYHYRFTDTYNKATIINMGALVRKTIKHEDLELKPAVGVWDTVTNKLDVHLLSCEPSETIFDFTDDKPAVTANSNEILRNLVRNLDNSSHTVGDWRQTLCEVLDKLQAGEQTRNLLNETLSKVMEGIKHG